MHGSKSLQKYGYELVLASYLLDPYFQTGKALCPQRHNGAEAIHSRRISRIAPGPLIISHAVLRWLQKRLLPAHI